MIFGVPQRVVGGVLVSIEILLRLEPCILTTGLLRTFHVDVLAGAATFIAPRLKQGLSMQVPQIEGPNRPL